MSSSTVVSLIDHSLLAPTLTLSELQRGCHEAGQAGVASVCVLPYFVREAAELLEGSKTQASTVVAFPHGSISYKAKVHEASLALTGGATEIDAVVNVSLVRSGQWGSVRDEVFALADCCHQSGGRLKLIFETCYLNDDQKLRLCELSAEANVDWVKTSTGFGPRGATVEDVRLLRAHCPPHVQVKASGGIGTLREVLEFEALGATRIGTSRTQAILQEVIGSQPTER